MVDIFGVGLGCKSNLSRAIGHCCSSLRASAYQSLSGNGVEGGHEADDGSDLRWQCFDDDAVNALRMVTEL